MTTRTLHAYAVSIDDLVRHAAHDARIRRSAAQSVAGVAGGAASGAARRASLAHAVAVAAGPRRARYLVKSVVGAGGAGAVGHGEVLSRVDAGQAECSHGAAASAVRRALAAVVHDHAEAAAVAKIAVAVRIYVVTIRRAGGAVGARSGTRGAGRVADRSRALEGRGVGDRGQWTGDVAAADVAVNGVRHQVLAVVAGQTVARGAAAAGQAVRVAGRAGFDNRQTSYIVAAGACCQARVACRVVEGI